MSDSDMEFDFDSEEELENLRKLREIIESDDDSLLPPNSPTFSLMSQVSDEIKDSTSSCIELSLSLNKQQDEKLLQLEKCLELRLLECRDRLMKIRGLNQSEGERSESFRYINCGKPYFKDRGNFPAPDNNDALIMVKNEMYDFSNITSVPGWTLRDKTHLWNEIEQMTKIMKRKELLSSIAALKREANKKKYKKKVIEKKISKIKKALYKLRDKTLEEIALPIDKEYDWEAVTHSLDRRHSATEYRSLWKLYLHPTITKKNWSKAEHQLLQKVTQEHGMYDWKTIAQKMKKNRTEYQCFVYFRTNMNNTFTGKKWSEEEVDYLLRLIEYYKEDNYIPWVKVAALMENRTKIQIYNKFMRLLEQRKGRFLPEEDTVLLTCVDDFGPNFRKMAQFLPGRSISQIRVRYRGLTKKRVSTVWTVEEDKKLLQLLSNQDNTANYASISKFFPGKDRIHIRARYVTLLKWLRRNPNVDIARAPRRGARRLGHGKPSENLNIAIESLRCRIQTEANKKKSNRINAESTEEAIEDGIVATLVNENQSNVRMAMNDFYAPDHLSILENDSNIMYNSLNEGNLHKVLLLLRAKLKREHFETASTSLKKSNFMKSFDQTCVVKVKSYSKQNKIKSVELNAPPDIWGNNTFKTLEYIMPPNYATITGCKKLMTFISNKDQMEDNPPAVFNFSLMGRKNVVLREQLDILMERFNSLFLWPLLLSNDGPNLQNVKVTPYTPFNIEVPFCGETDNNNPNAGAGETSEENVTVGVARVDTNPVTDSIEINIHDNKYSLTVKRY